VEQLLVVEIIKFILLQVQELFVFHLLLVTVLQIISVAYLVVGGGGGGGSSIIVVVAVEQVVLENINLQ
jgi:hypothetical protein